MGKRLVIDEKKYLFICKRKCKECPIRFKCWTNRGPMWVSYKELVEVMKE